MAESIMERDCREFARALASGEPVPGGGGAAAYAGALAVALCAMTGRFTVGKRAYAAVEADVRRMLAACDGICARLLELVDEDAAAFEPLSRAYGIPKDDPSRARALEEAAKAACVAPMEMMRLVCESIDLLEEMGRKGSRMLASDVGCGALLARAALEAAGMNVFANTGSLRDQAHARALEAECDRMLACHVPKAEAVAADVMARIRRQGA